MRQSQYRTPEGALRDSVREAQASWAKKAKAKATVASWGKPQPTTKQAQVSALTRAYRAAWEAGDDLKARRLAGLRNRVLTSGAVPPAQVRAII